MNVIAHIAVEMTVQLYGNMVIWLTPTPPWPGSSPQQGQCSSVAHCIICMILLCKFCSGSMFTKIDICLAPSRRLNLTVRRSKLTMVDNGTTADQCDHHPSLLAITLVTTVNTAPGHWSPHRIMNSTECPKKMLFSGKMALTSFKLIRKEHVGGVLENSG